MDWSPLVISLKTAGLATAITVVVGVPSAFFLSRPWRGRAIASGLIVLPLVLPPTVLGYFLLVLLGRRSALGKLFIAVFHHSLVFTWQGAAVAASVASMPLMMSQAMAAFASVSPEIQDAARVGGDEGGRQDLHVAGEDDEIDAGFGEQRELLRFDGRPSVARHRHVVERNAVEVGEGPRGLVVADDERDVGAELTGLVAVEEIGQTVQIL